MDISNGNVEGSAYLRVHCAMGPARTSTGNVKVAGLAGAQAVNLDRLAFGMMTACTTTTFATEKMIAWMGATRAIVLLIARYSRLVTRPPFWTQTLALEWPVAKVRRFVKETPVREGAFYPLHGPAKIGAYLCMSHARTNAKSTLLY